MVLGPRARVASSPLVVGVRAGFACPIFDGCDAISPPSSSSSSAWVSPPPPPWYPCSSGGGGGDSLLFAKNREQIISGYTPTLALSSDPPLSDRRRAKSAPLNELQKCQDFHLSLRPSHPKTCANDLPCETRDQKCTSSQNLMWSGVAAELDGIFCALWGRQTTTSRFTKFGQIRGWGTIYVVSFAPLPCL